jgi:TatA/E family protein of Tat protein translocase
MFGVAVSSTMFAFFSRGGGEPILVLALILILVGAKKLPKISQGVGRGMSAFRRATKEVWNELDGQAHDAGENPEHRVAERQRC